MHCFYGLGFGMGHITMMLLWLVIIGLVLWAVLSPKRVSTHQKSPIDIAKMRYAKGEITLEELNQIMQNL